MQDEPGLAILMGGEQAFADKLDAVFARLPRYASALTAKRFMK